MLLAKEIEIEFETSWNFVLLRLNLLGQRKLPIVFPLSGMLCLWPLSSQCASYTLKGSAARQTLTETQETNTSSKIKYFALKETFIRQTHIL